MPGCEVRIPARQLLCRILLGFVPIASGRIGPAVGGLIDSDSLQTQLIAERGLIYGIEDCKSHACKVFGGGNFIEDDGFVPRHGIQESQYRRIAAIDQESMVPGIDNLGLGQLLDTGEVHDHAIFGNAVSLHRGANQSDFDGVTMTMQMTTLAFVIGDAVTGIELEAARDLHGGGCMVES